jgi:hypothetical protein
MSKRTVIDLKRAIKGVPFGCLSRPTSNSLFTLGRMLAVDPLLRLDKTKAGIQFFSHVNRKFGTSTSARSSKITR